MLHHTRGLVLRNVKYSDTSLISKIYTEHFGVQSYMLQGIRSPRSMHKANLLQPMSFLSLVVYHKEGRNLQRVKEFTPAFLYNEVPFDVRKGAVGLFMLEVLTKCLKEETGDVVLFEFLESSYRQLDDMDEGLGRFHLLFLLALTRFMGFFPSLPDHPDAQLFDLREGMFIADRPTHPDWLDQAQAKPLWQLVKAYELNEPEGLNLSHQTRRVLLGDLLRYYEMHVANFSRVNAHAILETVFRD